jgi:hypothetical protein
MVHGLCRWCGERILEASLTVKKSGEKQAIDIGQRMSVVGKRFLHPPNATNQPVAASSLTIEKTPYPQLGCIGLLHGDLVYERHAF